MNKPVLPMSSLSLKLPTADRSIETYRLAASRTFPAKLEGTLNRVAFSAAHVVADPLADNDPWLDAAIDWDRTIAFREHLWDLGFGVAEAMDTAQRGMGMDWPTSLELIRRSVRRRRRRNALVFSGAGTDHLAPEDAKTIDDVIRAYEEQIAAIEKVGGRIILMASRALAKLGRSADDYAKVYDRVLSQVREPVIIHWLGDMFDPALAGYWGTKDLDKAMDIAVAIINANAAKVDGVKVSLLDKQSEIAMRRRLDKGVRMYTGDDFNYAELIAGDDKGYSHALLGIFDAIAPAASSALSRLAAGDEALPRYPGADRAAVAAYLPGADALLQDRRGVHGLSQRPSGSLHHGRRAGERALDAASGRYFPARRCGRPACRSGACARRMGTVLATRGVERLMRDFSKDHRWLSINTATVRKQGDFVASSKPARGAASALSPWRDQVAQVGLDRAVKAVRDAGLDLSGYCRGGMFTADEAHRRRRATTIAARSTRPRRSARPASCWWSADCRNIRGPAARPRRISPRRKRRSKTRSPRCWNTRKQANMPLAIEPLHPMYAADRACVNTTRQALDICDRLDPQRTGMLGVALDVYHIWWDFELMPQIERAGKDRLLAFHVCDWLVPTKDMLLDRGMMGDGVIDIKSARAAVEAEGFAGYVEVEIFSQRLVVRRWTRCLQTCIERHPGSAV